MPKIASITPFADSGVPATIADGIFDQIAQFAGYGFNKSHAAAYAAIAFQTAWLRAHHPEAFFAASMNLDLDDVEALSAFASELKIRRIPLWHPCVNRSGPFFAPVPRGPRGLPGGPSARAAGSRAPATGFAISYGLAALRGLGRGAAEAIVTERKRGGAFVSVEEFMVRMGGALNKRALQALARAGAFDRIARNRAEALRDIESGTKTAAAARAGQMSMLDLLSPAGEADRLEPLDRLEMLDLEFSTLGHYITGHPLDGLRDRLREDGLYFSRYILRGAANPPRKALMAAIVTRIEIKRTKGGETMAVLTLSDPDGSYEALVFGDTWPTIHRLVKVKAALVLEVAVSTRGGERRLIVEAVEPLALEAVEEAHLLEAV